MAMMNWMMVAQKREGALTEMENPLTIWMKAQIVKHVSLSLMMIQAKARTN
jgi:hypothetical protein